MTLDSDELILWGAAMFLAGKNRAEGRNDAALEFATAESIAEAKRCATVELPRFKQKIKEQRRRRPVS